MSAPTVEIVRDEGGDWTGLYFDGELVAEDHEIALGEVLTRLEDKGWLDGINWKGTQFVDLTTRRLPAFMIDLDRCIEG